MSHQSIKRSVLSCLDPDYHQSLKALGVNVNVLASDPYRFELQRSYLVADDLAWQSEISKRIKRVLGASVQEISVNTVTVARQPVVAKKHPKIKNVVAVFSGKGGVGKSTVTTLLAHQLANSGLQVGILDADIHGPSQVLMLQPDVVEDACANQPVLCQGVHVVSMGAYLALGQPAAWRGPMASKALMQIYQQTDWPCLDYLFIDCPPGTSDILLTIAKSLPVIGSVLVTTPQVASVMDAERAARLMEKLNVPILGIIENMSGHTCRKCGYHEDTFSAGGGEVLADTLKIPCWGQLPLNEAVCLGGEQGLPSQSVSDVVDDWLRQLTHSVSQLPRWSKLSQMPIEVVKSSH